jgi:thiol-disulfide isomerase/thioredoxin
MKYLLMALSVLPAGLLFAQTGKLKQTIYRGILYRQDGNEVVFNIDVKTEKQKPVFYVLNDTERLKITDIKQEGDSLFFNMPVFESSFRTKIEKNGLINGTWIKGTRGEPQYWPFKAIPGQPFRFISSKTPVKKSISGKWVVTFTNADGTTEKALAIFRQSKNKLSGTFLTTTGDYRYLDGVLTNDSIRLSTFDGSHAYIFTAHIDGDATMTGGTYYFGPTGKQAWTAVKDNNAALPEQGSPTSLKKGETSLNFAFNDLNDKLISLKDETYKDKVVIIELMGSWCPNCMDETKFLSDYYHNNKKRGVEVLALAYEYSTDLQRSKASLMKFKNRFNVTYPILITGVAVGDEQRTEKTLPQITPIRSFPTTIILDKKGKVREIQPVFYGPGTGNYYDKFVKEFDETVERLLKE